MQEPSPVPIRYRPAPSPGRIGGSFFSVMAILLLLAAAMAIALFVAAQHFDRQENDKTVQRVRRTLAASEAVLGATVRDYAGWDAATNHLTNPVDEAWADENVGLYLNGAFRVAATLVVNRQGQVTYAVQDGKRLSPERRAELTVPPPLQTLIGRSVATPPGMTEAMTGVVRLPDGLYLAGVADIRPGLGGPVREDGAALVFLMRLDRAAIARMLDTLLLDNVDMPSRPVVSANSSLLELREAGAAIGAPPVGWISWRNPLPAHDFLAGIAWVLALLCGVSITLAGWLLLREQRAAATRRAASEWLRQAGERYRGLIDTLPDAVCLLNDGRISLINRAGVELLNAMEGESLVGRHFVDLVYERDRLIFHRRMQAGGKPTRLEWSALRLTAANGMTVPVDLAILTSPDDGVGELTLVARDRRTEITNNENLRAAETRAAVADRAKGQFLANISHELRTPLNAIIGFSEILRDELLGSLGTQQYREYANDIYEGGLHLLRLVNDLLDIARMDAGTFELRESWVDITALIERCERLVREKAAEKGIPLRIDVSPAGIRVLSDEVRMKQIMVNLIGNAIRFSETGQRVDVQVRIDGLTGDLLIDVADHGIGMTVDAMRIALEPFAQVEAGHNRRQAGAGLGLPLAKGYAEAHGGTLTMQSTPAVGTTVTVRLPASRIGGPGSVR